MDYLTKNDKLIKKMTVWGFKRKNKYIFRKAEGDAILDFYFSHFTKGEYHVKYYTVNVNVWYPGINKIKINGDFHFGIPNSVIWNDLGHLMGCPVQKEFRISDDDDEPSVNMVVDRMCNDLQTYALPIMKRYSSRFTLIDDYEKGLLERFHVNKQTIALLYLMCHGKAKAIEYASRQLSLLQKSEPDELSVTLQEGKFADMDSVTISVKGNEFPQFKDLYEKIKTYNFDK